MSLVGAVSSDADDEGIESPDRQRWNMRERWLVVGRFDPQEVIGYVEFGEAMLRLSHDFQLEAYINPQRISQIRAIYADPSSTRGAGDSIMSKLGSWSIVPGELARDILGGGPDDEEALAHRYKETRVPHFYVYFSRQLISDIPFGPTFTWKTRE